MNNFESNENVATLVDVVDNANVNTTLAGKGIAKKAVGICTVTGLIAGGIACIVRKNKDKINNAIVKKLEKKGYMVIKPEPIDADKVDEILDNELTL